jgi:hypothetical protein
MHVGCSTAGRNAEPAPPATTRASKDLQPSPFSASPAPPAARPHLEQLLHQRVLSLQPVRLRGPQQQAVAVARVAGEPLHPVRGQPLLRKCALRGWAGAGETKGCAGPASAGPATRATTAPMYAPRSREEPRGRLHAAAREPRPNPHVHCHLRHRSRRVAAIARPSSPLPPSPVAPSAPRSSHPPPSSASSPPRELARTLHCTSPACPPPLRSQPGSAGKGTFERQGCGADVPPAGPMWITCRCRPGALRAEHTHKALARALLAAWPPYRLKDRAARAGTGGEACYCELRS